MRKKLGVNIDHIAVLREARRVNSPQILDAVSIVERSGGDQITIHLREDRRHIVDSDVFEIAKHSNLPLNLEMATAPEIVEIAKKVRPHRVTIVPEKREEVTTEGGLDLIHNFETLSKVIGELQEEEIEVSLFIDPDENSVKLSKDLGVEWVELHTGAFANLFAGLYGNLQQSHHKIDSLPKSRKYLENALNSEIMKIEESAKLSKGLHLKVAGGHGLNYQNLELLSCISEIEEFNIGQSIIARSVFVGLENAIREMKTLL
jgi:pyridoxine 5-phosphate synthase